MLEHRTESKVYGASAATDHGRIDAGGGGYVGGWLVWWLVCVILLLTFCFSCSLLLWLWWYRHTRVEVVHAVRDSQCAAASRIERACVGRRSSIVRDESVGHERKNVFDS